MYDLGKIIHQVNTVIVIEQRNSVQLNRMICDTLVAGNTVINGMKKHPFGEDGQGLASQTEGMKGVLGREIAMT